MDSFSQPINDSVQKWREADTSATAAEQALLDQVAAHIRGEEPSPTILQRGTAELLRAVADRLLVYAMSTVEAANSKGMDLKLAADQLATLKTTKP